MGLGGRVNTAGGRSPSHLHAFGFAPAHARVVLRHDKGQGSRRASVAWFGCGGPPIGTRRGPGQKEVNMFVQVIQGHVSDAAQVRAQLDRWVEEVAPGAVGWLGSTSGLLTTER
jgi:hypothetical protein